MIPAIGLVLFGFWGLVLGNFVTPICVVLPIWMWRRRPIYTRREEYGCMNRGLMTPRGVETWTGILFSLDKEWRGSQHEVLGSRGMAEIGAIPPGTLTSGIIAGQYVLELLANPPVPSRTVWQVIHGQPPIRRVPIPRTVEQARAWLTPAVYKLEHV